MMKDNNGMEGISKVLVVVLMGIVIGSGFAVVIPENSQVDATGKKVSPIQELNLSVLTAPLIWDNKVIVGCDDGRVYMLNLDLNQTIWTSPVLNGTMSKYLTADATGVYATTCTHETPYPVEGIVYKLSLSTGEILWNYSTGSGKIGGTSENLVFVGYTGYSVDDGYIIALNKLDGTEAWGPVHITDCATTLPALDSGKIYISGSAQTGVKFKAFYYDGAEAWSKYLGDADHGGYLVVDENEVFTLFASPDSSPDYYLRIYNSSSGNVKATYDILEREPYYCDFAVAPTKVIITNKNGVFAYERTNFGLLWSLGNSSLGSEPIREQPVVTKDTVIVGTKNNRINFINLTNGIVYKVEDVGAEITSPLSLLCGSSGCVYVGTSNGIKSVSFPTFGNATTWVSYGGDFRHTGYVDCSAVEQALPDLTLTSDDISFSNSNPNVDETIMINATIHNVGGNINQTYPSWEVKTEMNVLPDDPSEGWTLTQNGGTSTIFSEGGNNFLKIQTPATSPTGTLRYYIRNWTPDFSTGATGEVRMRTYGTNTGYAYFHLVSSDKRACLFIFPTYIEVTENEYRISLDTTVYHTYRLTIKGTTFKLFIDNLFYGEFQMDEPYMNFNTVLFGNPEDVPVNLQATSDWDYVYYTTKGAFPPEVAVNFYDGNPSADGVLIGTDTISSILTGGSGTASINWTPTTTGTHPIYVVVDPDNLIAESDEMNNEAYKSVYVSGTGLPDLTFTSDDITFSNSNPVVNETIAINATIHNTGNGTANNVTVAFYDGVPYEVAFDSSDAIIFSFGVYNGKLYSGSYGDPYSDQPGLGIIYVYNGTNWDTAYDTPEDCVKCFSVYKDKLYVGTQNCRENAQVYVYDGNTWSEIWSTTDHETWDFAVYNDKLYLGTGYPTGRVMVYDGSSWNTSFDSPAYHLQSLEVYKDRLYAGCSGGGRGAIYEFDGNYWNLSYDPPEDGFPDIVEYNDKLYACTWDGNIYVFDGLNWNVAYSPPKGVYRLSVYKDRLYAGGEAGIIYVFDGNNWATALDLPEECVYSLKAYDNKLYIGTGDSGRMYVYPGGTLIGTDVISLVQAGENAIASIDWTPTTTGNHTIYVVVDPDNLITESDETNNEAWKDITVNGASLPDLTLTSEDISFSNSNPNVDETITINATVHNAGENINQTFSDGFEDDIIGANPSKWEVVPGSSGDAIIVDNPIHTGNRSCSINDDILICKEMNGNITGFTVWIRANQTDELSEVRTGHHVGGSSGVRIRFGTDGNIGYFNGTTLYTISTYSTDTWYKILVIQNVEEKMYSLWINDTLIATNIAFFNSSANTYNFFTCDAGIWENHVPYGIYGTFYVDDILVSYQPESVIVNFYDGDPTVSGTLIGISILPPIPASNSEVASINWTPTTAGNHTIYVVIDPNNLIAESDETNNEAYKSVHVSGVDDIPPASCVNQISPYWQISMSFTITATASDNEGVYWVELFYRYSVDNVSWGNWVLFGKDYATPWGWSFNATEGDGYYQFYSIATDYAGNVEDAPLVADAICGVNTSVNQPPIVNITYPEDGQSVNGTVTISGSASDPDFTSTGWVDYILIGDAYDPPGDYSGVPNQTVNVNYTILGYALAYNITAGYLGLVSVSWSVINSGTSASTSPIIGVSSTFDAGLSNGTAIWVADAGDGHTDTVVFTIVSMSNTTVPNNSESTHKNRNSGTTVQKVEVKIDDGEWQLASGTTSWSFDWDTTTMDNGWHTIYARAFDGIDYSDVVSVSVYVDNPTVNQLPIVNITYPTGGQTVNEAVTITGTASDPDEIKKIAEPDGTTVQKVEIKIDDGEWQLASGTTSWSFEWNTTTVSNGWHTIYARAYDGVNYSNVVSVSVYVDNPILKAVISSPKENDVFFTTDSIYFDGANSTSIINPPPAYNWTSNISGFIGNTSQFYASLPAGSHLITLWVSVGNCTDYATVNITVIAPNQPPTAFIDSISPNPAIFGQGVTFTGHGTDTDGDVVAYNWRSSIDGVLSTSVSFSISTLSLGEHTIYFKVMDDDGEWSDEATETLVINLNVPPTVNITYPEDNQTVNGVVTLVGTASDSDGTVQKVEVKIDDDSWQTADGNNNWIFIWNTTLVSDGMHTVYARSFDGFDYSETKSVQVNVLNVVNQPPVAEFTVYQGIDVANGDEINITLRVSGEKYRWVNLSVYADEDRVGFVSVERVPGDPKEQENTTSILIDASKLYTIIINCTADKKGGNPVWLDIDYRGITYEEHMVFHETSTEEFNLTTILDIMIRSARMLRFDASGSYDPDGSVVNYTFDFGDSCLGYEKVMVHTYDDYGTYTVSLTVMDGSGDTDVVFEDVDILDVTGYYAGYKGMLGVELDCPADLLITDSYNMFIGYNAVNMSFENWIPNASMILFGDIEIYFIPKDGDYAYRVSGNGEGKYVFSVFSPGEYSPGEFGPGEFSPGEFAGKIYSVVSMVSSSTVDNLLVEDGVVSVNSSDDKCYSLYIKYGSELFSLEDVHITGGLVHNYTVVDWSVLSSTETSSVRLEVFNGSVLEAVQELCSGLFGYSLLKPDLVVVNVAIVGSLREGEVVSFSVEVWNKAKVTPASLAVARDVYVELWVDGEYVGSSSEISLIYSDSTKYAVVQWRVKSGSHVLRFVVCAEDDINPGNNEYVMSVDVEREKPLIVISPEIAAVAAGVGVGAGLVLFALIGTEIGKYKLFTVLAPLYMKTRKDDLLSQYTRGRVHGFIEANPGAHYSLIKRTLDLHNGTLAYHLDVLEKNGLVMRKKDGFKERFFPANKKLREIDYLSKSEEAVIDEIRAEPGITQKMLAYRLRISQPLTSYYATKMVEMGIITAVKDGKEIKYYLKEEKSDEPQP
ncbi:MAG: CARDB domain-containing protein [Thermoplasmatales archaeon]|nr:CARDB domain-containing protein [Thermoplasmatales archaeon]